MAVEVLAWNVRDGLSDPERAGKIADMILQQEADLVMISEAATMKDLGFGRLRDQASRFYAEGYRVMVEPYNDTDQRRDQHAWMAMSRVSQGIFGMQSIEMTGDRLDDYPYYNRRNAASVIFTDPETEQRGVFIGAHLDDRSEATRLKQAYSLVLQDPLRIQPTHATVMHGPGTAKILAGDLNAMHKDDPKAIRIRRLQKFVGLLPTIDPGEYQELSKAGKLANALHRGGSLGSRLVQMASGDTLELLERFNYTDADEMRRPTKGSYQLDHILHNHRWTVGSRGVNILPGEDMSDHSGVTAHLSLAQ